MSHHRQTLPPRVETPRDPRDCADVVVMEAARLMPLAAGRLEDGVPLHCCKGTEDNPPNNQVRKAGPKSTLSGSFSRVPAGTLGVMKARAQEPLANRAGAETCRYPLSHCGPLPKQEQVASEAAAGTWTGGSQ